MRSERAIDRYRRWYGRLLQLYPRPFRERFAEPMAQTFSDLARERSAANRGLLGFVVATFADTSTQIMRENMTQLMQMKGYGRWMLVTAAVLAVPALAMAIGMDGLDGVNWGPMDFAIVGVLVLGTGILYEYAASSRGAIAHRAAVGIAVLAGLGLVWVNLAVGMMDVENANLLYALVLFVALVGIAIGRFEPRHAMIAMFATAATHLAVAVVGVVASLGPTLLADAFWIAGWVAAALLFRHAARSGAITEARKSAT